MSRIDRIHAFCLVFWCGFYDNFEDESLEYYKNCFAEGEKFNLSLVLRTINGVFSNIHQIDKLIKMHLKGWSIERISKIDLSILRLATYEILFETKVNEKISINEAVELSKVYSDKDSPRFVNGVLGSISKDTVKEVANIDKTQSI